MNHRTSALWQQLSEIPAAVSGARGLVYQAVALPGHQQVFLAKDESGLPLFLIDAVDANSARSVRLAQLRVTHGLTARVQSYEYGEIDGVFSIVECRASEEALQRLFLECISNALPSETACRSASALNRLISHLVTLFESAVARPERSPAGLWGELFVITLASDVPRIVRAWHQIQEEHFDFSEADVRLEVKTSQSRDRRHSFSLEQANPVTTIQVCVASLVTKPSAGGRTIGDLRSQCLRAVGVETDLRAKIDRLCIEYLGAAWEDGLEQAFDEQTAMESLRLYDIQAIPRIIAPVPGGVTNVRFTSQLGLVDPITQDQLTEDSILSLISSRV